jgi:hypothetical protein
MEREREVEIETSGSGAADRGGDPAAGPDAFSIGELVNGRYSVVTRISEGPTGRLYRSRDLATGGQVTLQLLLGWPRLDEDVVRHLRTELAATRTPGGRRSDVAVVLDSDLTPDGRPFMVLEPVEGRTLSELIRWREPLSVERAQRLALQVARALRTAHDLGLVHGALAAEHVLVQPDDTVTLVGFEIARLRAAGRRASGAGQGDAPTAAADTQAVAMMLLEMLTTGVRPGPDGGAAPLEAPRGGAMPPALKQMLMRFMVRAPGAPSQDIGALIAALSAELEGRPARPLSRSWQRRARSGPRPGGAVAREDRAAGRHGGGADAPGAGGAPRRPRRWARMGVGALAFAVSASAAWMAWSLVAAPPRPPATAGPPGVAASAGPPPTTPEPPAPPASDAGAAPAVTAASPAPVDVDAPAASRAPGAMRAPAVGGSGDAAVPGVTASPAPVDVDAPAAPRASGATRAPAAGGSGDTVAPGVTASPAPVDVNAPAAPRASGATRAPAAGGSGDTAAPAVTAGSPAPVDVDAPAAPRAPGAMRAPAPGGDLAARRVGRLRATPPAVEPARPDEPPADPAPAAMAESASPRPRRAVRPPSGGAEPPADRNAPDPGAIIDWLITTRDGSPAGQPSRRGTRGRRGR